MYFLLVGGPTEPLAVATFYVDKTVAAVFLLTANYECSMTF